ncbi:RHS repeat-associated core domain-containing protein [Thalassotalea sp. 1_MG-2023]|uniref:RHS repeat domain-containing protein n=1 Tax=Thalassotalea sp. 1_MG-2023 TaxID=3062680 RepID=UPI0026E48C43|nr:RHS repeat-associated core domain-containing protein [Thalassotalea sp. 1_MG-2023]MDO6428808.1 RHS repeat-associated core domain-containing protein [Thalassotalea sp. 1_MG-2023]
MKYFKNKNRLLLLSSVFTVFSGAGTSVTALASQEHETPFKIIEPELLNQYKSLYKNRTTGAELSPATGGVTFAVTDISIPGNSSIPVELKRWVPQSDIRVGGFDSPASLFPSVSWSWDIPVVKMNYMGSHAALHPDIVVNGTVEQMVGGVPTGKNCSETVAERVFVSNRENSHNIEHYTYWEGKQLHIPGKTTEKFLEQETDEGAIQQVTKSNYVVEQCFTIADSNEEGMIVKAPDGTKYTFGKVKKYFTGAPAPMPDSPLTTYTKLLMVTQIEDRFGNTVDYKYYSHGHLKSISGSDGRSIEIDYTRHTFKARTYYLADTATTGSGKTWTYHYTDYQPQANLSIYRKQLTSVTLPDNTTWQYDLNLKRIAFSATNNLRVSNYDLHGGGNIPGYCEPIETSNNPNNAGSDFTTSVTNPDGLTVDYSFSLVYNGRSDVSPEPYSKSGSGPIGGWRHYLARNLNCNVSFALVKKEVTGQGIDKQTWSYAYSENTGTYTVTSYNDAQTGSTVISEPSHSSGLPAVVNNNKQHYRTVMVTKPKGRSIYYIDRKFQSPTEGEIVAEDHMNTTGTLLLKRIEYTKSKSTFVGRHWFIPSTAPSAMLPNSLNENQLQYRVNQTRRKVTMYDGNSTSIYYVDQSDFDELGFNEITHEHNNFNSKDLYTKQEYFHDKTNWVLGLPTKKFTSATSSFDTIPDVEIVYHSASNTDLYSNWHLPYEYKSFGTWLRRYEDYITAENYLGSVGAKGKVGKILYNELIKDGNGDTVAGSYRDQIYSGYKRGKAQTISVPGRYTDTGRMNFSRTINSDGWITSVTDLNGNNAAYSYNQVGLLSKIDLPSPWYDYKISWSQVAGQPITRTVERCHLTGESCAGQVVFRSTAQLDAFYRVVNEHNKDVLNNLNTYQKFEFDESHNQIFASYVVSTANTTSGIHHQYDDLNRLVGTTHDGGGTVTTSYLSKNRISVTDAGKNTENNTNARHTTTTTYLAYGSPAYKQATLIVAPEGVASTTTINVNLYGNITSIKQEDTANNVALTEYRAYDEQQNLCQIKRADVGTTVMSNSVLGEIQWQAQGQTSTSNTSCNTSAEMGTKVSFIYDNLGAQRSISYQDGTPTKYYTLDPGGNIKQISQSGYSQKYSYNSLELLEDETLTIDGQTFKLDYNYDALGHLTSLAYPDEQAPVTFTPNAFGQATEAKRGNQVFAENAVYYANGVIDSFTYGNGLHHKTTLNSRQLPSQLRDYGSNNKVQLSYAYDNNGNIKSITNGVDTNFSISDLHYDELDRLTATIGNLAGVGSSTITYDGLGNIRTYNNTSSFDAQALTYQYNNKNRLTGVADTGPEAHQYDFTNGYDNRGNVINNGQRLFEYNLANQMKNSNGNVYHYDGYNRRIKANDSKGISYSVYSQSGQLLYRETPEGGINYIFLGKKLIAKEGTGVTIPNDSIMNYKPFGDSIEQPKDEVGYTGHKFDTDLGLSYMQARYYDPVIGRFYSNDPVGFRDVHNFNRYAYAANNPYKYVDPDGKDYDAIYISVKIPMLGSINAGYVSFKPNKQGQGKNTRGLFLRFGAPASSVDNDSTKGQLQQKAPITKGAIMGITAGWEKGSNTNENFDGTDASIDVGLGPLSGSYGGVTSDESSLAFEFGAAIGVDATVTQTFSITGQDVVDLVSDLSRQVVNTQQEGGSKKSNGGGAGGFRNCSGKGNGC